MVDQMRGWGIMVLRVGTGLSFLIHDGETILRKLLDQPDELFTIRGGQVILLCLCGAALVLGLFTRWASLILAMGMLANVLFIETYTSMFDRVSQDVGFEYALLRLIASLALVLGGPGKAAVGNIRAVQGIPTLARLQR
jgi:uncharacterized membrane protein YphA (DoxX/SURF4 family)